MIGKNSVSLKPILKAVNDLDSSIQSHGYRLARAGYDVDERIILNNPKTGVSHAGTDATMTIDLAPVGDPDPDLAPIDHAVDAWVAKHGIRVMSGGGTTLPSGLRRYRVLLYAEDIIPLDNLPPRQ